MRRLHIRIAALWIALALCLLCCFGWTAAALGEVSQPIDETFYEVETDKIPGSIRIVFLSDLHLSTFGEDNCDLVERVRLLQPDLILIGGDMNKRLEDDYSIAISLCRQLVEITDVYYGLGNHELSRMLSHDRDIFYDLEKTGVILVHNTFQKAKVGESAIYIGGVSQEGKAIAAYSEQIIERLAKADGFKLLLSHYPSNFPLIYPYDIDLVVSGHLHGGIIRLPFLGGLLSDTKGFFPKYTEGEFMENGTLMIVSRGLGSSSAIPRINNPPELVIVDILGTDAAN